jgi:hypothetical protein
LRQYIGADIIPVVPVFPVIPAFQTFLLYDRSAIPVISSFSPVVVVTENNINIRKKGPNNSLGALPIVKEIAN